MTKQYLLSVYQPDGDPPPPEILANIMRDVDAWTQELEAAGEWVFSAGLHPASTATVVRFEAGDVFVTDGPYAAGKEHVGGFTIVSVADLDVALERASKLTRAIGLPVEVRPLT